MVKEIEIRSVIESPQKVFIIQKSLVGTNQNQTISAQGVSNHKKIPPKDKA